MNTEFPTRIPTIINSQPASTTSATSANSTTAKDTSTFQKQVVKAIQDAVKTIKSLADKVTDFFESKVFSNNSEIKVKVETPKASTSSRSGNFNILHETVDTLKSLTHMVGNFFNRDIFHPFRKKDDNEENSTKTGEESKRSEEKEENKEFRRFVRDGINGLRNSSNKGIFNLQQAVNNTALSIGAGVGRVFGQGIFGNMISKIITKALNFAVSKVLIGFVLANLPWVAIGAGLIAAIYLIIKYAKKIWSSIKWLGDAIDQGFDAVISYLPGYKSKYEKAREDIANRLGVTPETVLDYYGDTVSGRNQALEDARRMEGDAAFAYDMYEKFNDLRSFVDKKSVTPESLKYASAAEKTAQYIQDMSTNITNNYYGKEFDEDNWEGGMSLIGDAAPSMTNVVNTTNNTSVSPNLSDNVYNVSPYSPLSLSNSDAWEGGMSKINW